MKDLPAGEYKAVTDQQFLPAQDLSRAAQLEISSAVTHNNVIQESRAHLPELEIQSSLDRPKYSHSARDLGMPIKRSYDPNSLLTKRIDPRSISFNIGTETPRPYYDRYSAGASITVTNRSSTAVESNGRTDVSIGVGAEYANPSTRVQVFAQPLGTEKRFGIKFSTSF